MWRRVLTLPTPADFRSRALSRFHQNATREQVVTSRAAPSPSIPYERSCRPAADSRLCRPADLNNDKPFAGRCDSGASWRASRIARARAHASFGVSAPGLTGSSGTSISMTGPATRYHRVRLGRPAAQSCVLSPHADCGFCRPRWGARHDPSRSAPLLHTRRVADTGGGLGGCLGANPPCRPAHTRTYRPSRRHASRTTAWRASASTS